MTRALLPNARSNVRTIPDSTSVELVTDKDHSETRLGRSCKSGYGTWLISRASALGKPLDNGLRSLAGASATLLSGPARHHDRALSRCRARQQIGRVRS